MDSGMGIMITLISAIVASSGLWAFLQHISDKKSAKSMMLLGLGHDRIIWLCKKYIEQGWISSDDYENLHDYLYKPYLQMGGNGTAKRMMDEVSHLPLTPPHPKEGD